MAKFKIIKYFKFPRFLNRQKMSEKPAAKFIDLRQIVVFAAEV